MVTNKKEYQRAWYQANKEQLTKLARARRHAERAASGDPIRPWSKSGATSRRDYDLRRKYGITAAEYDELEKKQEGRCLICLEDRPLHVDHCHTTGVVRGLLCQACNTAIGKLGEDTERLNRAIDYLAIHAIKNKN
jgi:hypothetical protein